jgi:hypothetical protein
MAASPLMLTSYFMAAILLAMLNPARIWRIPVAALLLGVIYLCQAVPHAHGVDKSASARHADHSHSSDRAHHHHSHDETTPDRTTHHHHALSWHLDVHFTRTADESPNTGGDQQPASLCELTPPRVYAPLIAWCSRAIELEDTAAIAPLPPRGPPVAA